MIRWIMFNFKVFIVCINVLILLGLLFDVCVIFFFVEEWNGKYEKIVYIFGYKYRF